MDSIVRSVRSAISLGSITSSRGRRGTDAGANTYAEIEGHGLKAAHAAYLKRKNGDVEAYVMSNMAERSRETVPGGIHVESELAQQNNMV